MIVRSGPTEFKAFYMKDPKRGRMMSTLILFTPEGIVLQGDLTPSRQGNVSCSGYGLDWFAGKLSESYLCEKFLHKGFVPALAREGLKQGVLDKRREKLIDKEEARDLWDSIRISDDFVGPVDTYEFWIHLLQNDSSECPGHGYDPTEAGWLCAIQQRFSDLYNI